MRTDAIRGGRQCRGPTGPPTVGDPEGWEVARLGMQGPGKAAGVARGLCGEGRGERGGTLSSRQPGHTHLPARKQLGDCPAPQATPDKRRATTGHGSESSAEPHYKSLECASPESSDVEITGAWLAPEATPPAFVPEAAARARRAPPVSPAENAWKPSDEDPRDPRDRRTTAGNRRPRKRVSKKRRVLKRPVAAPSIAGPRALDHAAWRESIVDVLAELPEELHPTAGRHGPSPHAPACLRARRAARGPPADLECSFGITQAAECELSGERT